MGTKDKRTPSDERADSGHPYQIGKPYFIRTITHYYTGRIVEVTNDEIVVDKAAWIACTKRLADTLKTGKFEEVEPFPDGNLIIGRGTVVDAFIWPHDLPREQV